MSTVERGLRRAVHADDGRDAFGAKRRAVGVPRGRRRHVDDPAAALVAHRGDDGLREIDRARAR